MPDPLLENVKRMQAAGVPNEEIGKFIKQYQSDTALESEEGFQRRRATDPSREVSTVTGAVVPTPEEKIQAGRDMAATAVRYIPPVAAGIVNPSLAIPTLIGQAAIAGGSEFAARRIERAESDPELDTLWNDLKAGGATGVLDLGVNLAFKGMGKAIRRVGEKFLIPSETPLDIRITQEVLGELPGEPIKVQGKLRRFVDFVTRNNAKRPFSLTFGKINAEEQRFITWLEGIARSGIGSRGVMTKFYARNERALENLIKDYVVKRSKETTAPEFVRFAKRIIGDLKQPRTDVGEMFLPVEAYRKYLYTQFESALVESGAVVDGTTLRRFIRSNEATEEGLTRKVYNAMRSEGLVPPLEAPSSIQRRITTTKTKRVGEEAIDEMQDITRTDLLTGAEKRKFESAVGKRASATEGTSQTVRETETIAGMTEAELAQDWANLPAPDVDKITKVMNTFWKDEIVDKETAKRINRLIGKMKDEIQPRLEKAMSKETKELRDAANLFFGKEKDYMHDVAINALRKVIARRPTGAMAMLGGGTVIPKAKATHDRLMSLKSALGFSAETPRVGAALSKAVSEAGFPAGKEAMQQMYDKAFLRPLRYRMIVGNVDDVNRLDPNRFLKMLDDNADVPEFFEEVFGGPMQVEEIKRYMTALATQRGKAPEKNIFIQLIQAGQIVGLSAGVTGAILSDDVEMKTGSLVGGVAVFLGPYALARMLTNPVMTRAFTDGVKGGARSGRLAMSLRKVAEMKVASTFYRDHPSQDAIDYYTSMEPETKTVESEPEVSPR